jgi:hypothetical protein
MRSRCICSLLCPRLGKTKKSWAQASGDAKGKNRIDRRTAVVNGKRIGHSFRLRFRWKFRKSSIGFKKTPELSGEEELNIQPQSPVGLEVRFFYVVKALDRDVYGLAPDEKQFARPAP